MREIVTVQVGSFSNFIGSHFWNFQDELLGLAAAPSSDPVFKDLHKYLNMDVLYRSGETPQGHVTYTPRLLSIDYQGSLGSVSSRGTLYNDEQSQPDEVATWKGNVSRQTSEPHKRNLFLQSLQDEEVESMGLSRDTVGEKNESTRDYRDEDMVENLDRTVEFWTDYSKVHYHPQSLYQLSGLLMDTQEFVNYGTGRDIYSEGQRGEEISERLRFFVEECDHIQGFQFIVDESGGFSAIAAEFLENVTDEYSNTPILLYNAMDPCFPIGSRSQKQTVSRSIQDAVSFTRLSSFAKLIMPVGLPFLSNSAASAFLLVQDEKAYHCSAIYAAALHSATLPFRMEQLGPTASSPYFSGGTDVNTLVQTLAGQARQNTVTIVDVAMPAPPVTGKQDKKKSFLGYLQPLTPEIAEVEDLQAVESIAVQGALKPGGQRASVSEVTDTVSSAYEEMQTRPQFCHLSVARCPLPVPLPFPMIFGKQIDRQGELLSRADPGSPSRRLLDVDSIPLAARLRSSKAVLPFLECRLRNLRRFGIDRGAPGAELLCSWGFGKEDLEEIEESLYKMVTTLDERAEASSDSD